MIKRRKLTSQQDVILIYITGIGYVRELATLVEYRRIIINNVQHEIPVFVYQNKEITGLECFWLLPENAINEHYVLYIQKQIIEVQIKALELGITMPQKILDPQLKIIAKENNERLDHIIKKLGFDPRDETWIEKELADGQREHNWFQYERENSLSFSDNYDDIVAVFNSQYQDNISVEQAMNMSKKRMRYYLGAYHTRLNGNANVKDWISAAVEFEKVHRERENRMMTWSTSRGNVFPIVKTIQPIRFLPGPYFKEFSERCPQLFDGIELSNVVIGTVLRVISYDEVDKYIRLDFTADIRKLIKPNEPSNTKIWIKQNSDYDLWLKPEQIETHLEKLEWI